MLKTSVQTIGQIAAQRPEALRVLNEHGVDYCCGGNRSIEDACRQAGIAPETLLAEVDRATVASDGLGKHDWATASLTELCDHIEQTHHTFLREQLPYIAELFEKVVAAHGDHRPELSKARDVFHELRAELEPHMFKEEQVLFPAIRNMEAAQSPLSLPFGSVQNPIGVMEHEHASAGEALRQLRKLTDEYRIPEGACNSHRGLLELLQRLEVDLHAHIHKENNILFPRAMELEQSLRSTS